MVEVGDLVYIVSMRQERPLPKQTKGIVFSQLDDDWFRVYISWGEQTRVQDFPRWMLHKIKVSS